MECKLEYNVAYIKFDYEIFLLFSFVFYSMNSHMQLFMNLNQWIYDFSKGPSLKFN